MIKSLLFSTLFFSSFFLYAQCSNLTDGGLIGYDEISCGPFDPAPIQNLANPSGGTGTIEYMWIQTYDPNNYGMPNAIPGANSITYDPPMIYQTTWFVRCARRAGCAEWVGESIVEKRVYNLTVSATVTPIGCNSQGGHIDIDASGGDWPYTYYVDGALHSWNTNYSVGQHIIKVVDDFGCEAYDTVYIEQSDFSIDVSVYDEPCSFVNDYALVTASGGSPPYSYSWSNGDNDGILQDGTYGLQGYYSVTVSDQNGCEQTQNVHFDIGGPASASISCCADTVICLGTTAYIAAEIGGSGPWVLNYTVDGMVHVDSISQLPHYIDLSPSTTSIVELISIEGNCGIQPACGKATIAVNDCDPNSCLNGCFFSNVPDMIENNGCIDYTMYLTSNGCTTDLSNATISIPCGTVSNMYNDEGFPMSILNNPDPNTGLMGIKIDNINGIGPNDYFKVQFTLCPDGCNQVVMSCTPLVAFKAGPCVYYAQAISYEETFFGGWNKTELSAWPNPFTENCFINIKHGDFQQYLGLGELFITDINGTIVKTYQFQSIPLGGMTLMWDGKTDDGRECERGIYFVNYRMDDQHGNRVNRRVGIRIVKG